MIDYNIVWQSTLETLYMVGVSTIFTILLGVPLGVMLVITDKGHIWEKPWLHRVLGFVVNFFRAVPFIIIALYLFPVSKFLFGTSLGTTAAIVPLVVGTAPFFARIVETSLREVDYGVIQAVRSMGATKGAIVGRVMLPEALPSLISGVTVTFVALIGFSTMAGMIGGGGLGDAAYRYGFESFNDGMLIACGIAAVILVQLVQLAGNQLVRLVEKK